MARIRTIKPEFWTDSKIVRLPFAVRLFYIGLWNFCDDSGYIEYEPIRLKMCVFPEDPIDPYLFIDLLEEAGFIEKILVEDKLFLKIIHFNFHQKISNPTPSKMIALTKKKIRMPGGLRRELAIKYGCKPGQEKEVECYYCGKKGQIWWPCLSNKTPGYWVAFSLQIDHFVTKSQEGETSLDNLVLACEECNKTKYKTNGYEYLQKILENSRELCLERKGMEKERNIFLHGAKKISSVQNEKNKKSEKKEVIKISLPLNDNNLYNVTEDQILHWLEIYPGVSVFQELQRMEEWLKNNPRRRKTNRGIKNFITGWLKRAQDNGGRSFNK